MLLSLLSVYRACPSQITVSHNKRQDFSYKKAIFSYLMSRQFLLSVLGNLSLLLHRRYVERAQVFCQVFGKFAHYISVMIFFLIQSVRLLGEENLDLEVERDLCLSHLVGYLLCHSVTVLMSLSCQKQKRKL